MNTEYKPDMVCGVDVRGFTIVTWVGAFHKDSGKLEFIHPLSSITLPPEFVRARGVQFQRRDPIGVGVNGRDEMTVFVKYTPHPS